MLPEDLSILYSFKKNEEDLYSKYSNENIVHKSVFEEAQTPIYKQEKSVLDQIHNSLSNINHLTSNHVNNTFNMKGLNLGTLGVIEKMAGLVANREEMDLNNISLTETYKDKSLDTKVMGGLYNFTLVDMYKDKQKWLQMQGAFTFGGLIKGNVNSEIESDYHEYSAPMKKEENRFETKTAKNILSSPGFISKEKKQNNLSGEDYGYVEYNDTSLEGASIYTQLSSESSKSLNKKKVSMQDLIDAKMNSNNENNNENKIIIEKSKNNFVNFSVYSDTSIYKEENTKNKTSINNKKNNNNKNLSKFISTFRKFNDKKKKKKKIKDFELDTLKQTRDSHQKIFTEKNNIHEKKQLRDNHDMNNILRQNIENKQINKETLSKKDTENKLEKKEFIINEKKEVIKDFSFNITSSTKKEIPKLNLKEESPIIKEESSIKKENLIYTKNDKFDINNLLK